MRLVFISDTHCQHDKLIIPECDILISCGDYSFQGTEGEVRNFHNWLNNQPAKYKISVQGNHELGVEENFLYMKQIAEEKCPGVYFITEGLVEIEGIKIWCSAYTPEFCNWAFNKKRGLQIKQYWDNIPNDTKVLVTHGPPAGILDLCPNGDKVGCNDLMNRILEVNPQIHAFGHIHHSYGMLNFNGTTFLNASICDEQYYPTNKPIVIEL